ncbi:hypothetical protein IRJ41_013866 [Triplophysa rosa]|uniref:Uncharacterized protein n=1 Tax=Triplophysa rosa TaxID=992332 RepID=A0A9W7TTN3_TRIRA|nr:hypothetical protein IRJ41_013866 [Triplophysa rosa]
MSRRKQAKPRSVKGNTVAPPCAAVCDVSVYSHAILGTFLLNLCVEERACVRGRRGRIYRVYQWLGLFCSDSPAPRGKEMAGGRKGGGGVFHKAQEDGVQLLVGL